MSCVAALVQPERNAPQAAGWGKTQAAETCKIPGCGGVRDGLKRANNALDSGVILDSLPQEQQAQP